MVTFRVCKRRLPVLSVAPVRLLVGDDIELSLTPGAPLEMSLSGQGRLLGVTGGIGFSGANAEGTASLGLAEGSINLADLARNGKLASFSRSGTISGSLNWDESFSLGLGVKSPKGSVSGSVNLSQLTQSAVLLRQRNGRSRRGWNRVHDRSGTQGPRCIRRSTIKLEYY